MESSQQIITWCPVGDWAAEVDSGNDWAAWPIAPTATAGGAST